KTARRWHYENGAPERVDIITFEGAFHGRSLAAISAGGNQKYIIKSLIGNRVVNTTKCAFKLPLVVLSDKARAGCQNILVYFNDTCWWKLDDIHFTCRLAF
ncbi:MAG: aminotransferase class III-fold pyridoxal phosphate-dependent enzyme, partial [Psychrosphaera sp.]|nr:aminotransferase class III-fold pyridoxal phosphate-dependent enzyme [Psychrosphaera sp.]